MQEIVTALNERKIPYMLSGSLAMSAYTIPRMTRDIDIVIDLDVNDIETFLQIFSPNFYFHRPGIEEEIRRRGMFNVIDHRSGYKIDFVVKKNTPYRKVEFERKRQAVIFGFETWLVSAEDLILSKLIWIQELQSEKQIEDIKNLFENSTLDLSYIKRWIKELNLETFNLI
ncbi:MAG: DUF6036 family nucleotidyltransferase [Cyclobacteriaceae bacterium]